MNNQDLRPILLNLHYRLSDNDRERLHFYFKNEVPRTISDDSTLSGTLKLMQSLFDQDKINDHDFTLLIDALKKIQCSDAVQLLKEHQRRMRLTGLNQSTNSLASIMPSLVGELLNDCNEDKWASTETVPLNTINCNNNNNTTIDSNNITINHDTERSPLLRKKRLYTPWIKNKYFLVPFILFLLAVGSLIFVLIKINDRSKYSENSSRINDIWIVQTQNLLNKIVKDINNNLTDGNKQKLTIDKLNKTLTEMQDGRKTVLIKPGRIFGGGGGGHFDDSSIPMFTSYHYLSGFRCSNLDNLDACQFIYTSSRNNHSRIESLVHGTHGRPMNKSFEYHLNEDDRIHQVRIRSAPVKYPLDDGSIYTPTLIKGIQFVTRKGRVIPSDTVLINYSVETEYFPGYTLGYVTGKSGLRIDQLQLFWYLTEE